MKDRIVGRFEAGWPWHDRIRRSDLQELIDFRGQNEILFGQAVDSVRPGGDLDSSPCQKDIGVMTLFLGDLSYLIYEGQGGLEIREFVCADEVMFV
jgi:hypothetical protein